MGQATSQRRAVARICAVVNDIIRDHPEYKAHVLGYVAASRAPFHTLLREVSESLLADLREPAKLGDEFTPRWLQASKESRMPAAQLNYCLVEATRVVAAELVREGQGPPPGVDEHAVATGTMQTLREMPGEHLKWLLHAQVNSLPADELREHLQVLLAERRKRDEFEELMEERRRGGARLLMNRDVQCRAWADTYESLFQRVLRHAPAIFADRSLPNAQRTLHADESGCYVVDHTLFSFSRLAVPSAAYCFCLEANGFTVAAPIVVTVVKDGVTLFACEWPLPYPLSQGLSLVAETGADALPVPPPPAPGIVAASPPAAQAAAARMQSAEERKRESQSTGSATERLPAARPAGFDAWAEKHFKIDRAEVAHRFSTPLDAVKALLLASAAAAPGSEEEASLRPLLLDQAFFMSLNRLLTPSSPLLHGLALRLQFHALSLKFSANPEALSKEFEVSATLYSGGASFHPHVSNSLFNILLGDVRKFGSRERLETALTISFSPEIINPTIWRALFRCLARSRLEYRTAALNDVTTVIINSHANVKSLMSPGWDSALFELLIDVPVFVVPGVAETTDEQFSLAQPIQHELKGADALKSVYLNVVNIVTLCQHEVFFNDENFRQVLTATVQDLIVFAGYSSKSQRLCSIILTAMCNRIAANKHMFPSSGYDSPAWRNLLALSDVIRKFIFQTVHWTSVPPPGASTHVGDEEEQGKAARPPLPRAISDGGSAAGAGGGTEQERYERSRRAFHLTGCLLDNVRPRNDEKTFEVCGREMEDHGFHWTGRGYFADLDLLKAVRTMFARLELTEEATRHYFESAVLDGSKEEKEFLATAVAHCQFWASAEGLVTSVNSKAIHHLKILTYRQLSWFCEKLITAKTQQARDAVLHSVQQLYMSLADKGVP